MRTLLQFESTAKSLDTDDDTSSPYIQDQQGNVFLKKELQAKGELSSEDIEDDDYDYEYVIEEDVEYEHIMTPAKAIPLYYQPLLKS